MTRSFTNRILMIAAVILALFPAAAPRLQAKAKLTPAEAPSVYMLISLYMHEGAGPIPDTNQVRFGLSAASNAAVTVHFQTSGGSATAGADYAPISHTVRFEAGETNKGVRLDIVNDTLHENSETIGFRISDAVGATIEPGNETKTTELIDNDAAPRVLTDAPTTSVREANTHLIFYVMLETPAGVDLQVAYNTSDGTATAGSDYRPAAGTLTIPAGQQHHSVIVDVNDDLRPEGAETFTFSPM